jgi:hypothetical protein
MLITFGLKVLAAILFMSLTSVRSGLAFVTIVVGGIYIMSQVPNPTYLLEIHPYLPVIVKMITGVIFLVCGDMSRDPNGPDDDNYKPFLIVFMVGLVFLFGLL